MPLGRRINYQILLFKKSAQYKYLRAVVQEFISRYLVGFMQKAPKRAAGVSPAESSGSVRDNPEHVETVTQPLIRSCPNLDKWF
jgi:hypothetical protein